MHAIKNDCGATASAKSMSVGQMSVGQMSVSQ